MIELKHITKSYHRGERPLKVLDDVSLSIQKGEFVAITGPSGSGKSTLMSIIGCLDQPDQGQYFFYGKSLTSANDDELARIRNRCIGFVFQQFNLVPRLTAVRNVELPLIYAGVDTAVRNERALAILNILGLADRSDHTSSQLSGGQQQRVAIARALVNNPELIIADEPTGSLDSHAAHDVMELLKRLHETGKTIVLVTHDQGLVQYAKRNVKIADGRIVEDLSI